MITIIIATLLGIFFFSVLVYFAGETSRKEEIKKEYQKSNLKMSFNEYKETYYNRI